MPKSQQIVASLLGRFIFREGSVVGTRDLTPHFRQLEIEGPGLQQAPFEPGDKIQVYLTEEGGLRTYTPIAWDAQRGATRFLVYVHGTTPGARWGREAKVGDRCQLFGPRRSLGLGPNPGPLVLFGDETSFAVAQSLAAAYGPASIRSVFEVNDAAESTEALRQLALPNAAVVERRAGDAHLVEVGQRLATALREQPAKLVMTGKAQSIQTLRTAFRANGTPPPSKVKAYWSVGKTGLD